MRMKKGGKKMLEKGNEGVREHKEVRERMRERGNKGFDTNDAKYPKRTKRMRKILKDTCYAENAIC